MESDSNTNLSWCSQNSPQEQGKVTGDLRKNWNHPDHRTTKIGYDTEKSPGNLRRLAVI